MADSTNNVDEISSSQAQKEVTANDFFKSGSRATEVGRRGTTSTGLTWGYYGTPRWYINGTATAVANGTVALTGSSTRYVSISRAGVVAQDVTAFAPANLAMYSVVTGVSTVSSYQDHRDPRHLTRFLYDRQQVSVAAGVTTVLTYAQAMADSLEFTGSPSSIRDVIFPAVPRSWIVYNNTTGSPSADIRCGLSGSPIEGVTIAQGKRAIIECDGTTISRVTADA